MVQTWTLLLWVISQAKVLDCDERLCPSAWVTSKQRGDGFCDLSCNTVPCGFDSGMTDLSEFHYTDSNCYTPCSELKCSIVASYQTPCVLLADFGKGECNKKVDTAECGWDVGLCGYCAHNCELYVGFEEDLGNQVCQENCDSEECAYDGGDCVLTMQGFCNSGCFEEMLGNGVCWVSRGRDMHKRATSQCTPV